MRQQRERGRPIEVAPRTAEAQTLALRLIACHHLTSGKASMEREGEDTMRWWQQETHAARLGDGVDPNSNVWGGRPGLDLKEETIRVEDENDVH